MVSKEGPSNYEFSPFRLDAARRLLLREGESVPLTPKCFELLLALVESSGEVLTKEELIQRIWPDSFVEEGNLTYNISILRKVLGERANEHQYIVTVPGRGYQFVASVIRVSSDSTEAAERALGAFGRKEKAVNPNQSKDTYREETITTSVRAADSLFNDHGDSISRFIQNIFRIKSKKIFISALALMIVALIGAWAYSRLAGSGSTIRSIAVLPFERLGQEQSPDDDYLSDGLTESIINNLTRLPDLRVIPRNTVFRYKDKQTDPIAAGKALGVQAVLVGRLLQREHDVMLSVGLVDVQHNAQLWGEHYNRRMDDFLALQGEISRDVTNRLRGKLSHSDAQLLVKDYTENAEAYLLYLKARFYWSRRAPKDVEKAIEACQQAIAIDPNYALAYVGLSDAYSTLPNLTPREGMLKARDAAVKALALDDNLAEAHSALGRVLVYSDYDLVGAEREYRRAIELNPNLATAHHRYGELLTLRGQTQESSAEFLRSLELEPLSIIFNANYGLYLIFARRYDEAIAQLETALELDERSGFALSSLSWAYQLKGDFAQSVEQAAKAMEVAGNYQSASLARKSFANGGWPGYLRYMGGDRQHLRQSFYYTAIWHAALGERDLAMAALNNALEERSPTLVLLSVDPRVDSLRSAPRFTDLLRRVGFAQ